MKEWLKLLLYSICIISLLLHLLPDGKFVKYVRFYAGLLFFLIALEPLLALFLENGEIAKTMQLHFLKEDYRDLSCTVEGLGELKNTQIQNAYQKEICRQIAQIATSCTGEEATVQITFSDDGYTPAEAVIHLSSSCRLEGSVDPSRLSLAVKAVRQELFSVYALTPESIHIFDTGGASL